MSRFSNAEIIECHRDRSRVRAQIQVKERQIADLRDELDRLNALDKLADSVAEVVDGSIPIKMYGEKPDVDIELVNPPTRGVQRSAKIYLNKHGLKTFGLILERWDTTPSTEYFCGTNYSSWDEVYNLALKWIIHNKRPKSVS